jgi:hypothetical protein
MRSQHFLPYFRFWKMGEVQEGVVCAMHGADTCIHELKFRTV